MSEAYIISAARTPIGSFLGALASQSAARLGQVAITAALERAQIDGSQVDQTIMGQVLTGACGQNPARQAAIGSSIPAARPAITINQVCGSGLRAVALASQAIGAGESSVVVAGGQESMSNSPHASVLRNGKKMGDVKMVDTMIADGLWCAFENIHMGITAENVAKLWDISREEQDAFAVQSQNRAEAAQSAGRFTEEIAPVSIKARKGTVVVSEDEYIRKGATLESIAGLRPAFDPEGSVSAGNASGINDGGAALVLASGDFVRERNIEPMARIVSFAQAGVEPKVMGSGPIPASQLALERAGWSVADLNLVEANEAFAAQALAVQKDMGWSSDITNVNGGAIALGHPIGASGARVLVTLLHELRRRGGGKGLATLCIGGGMGVTLCVEC